MITRFEESEHLASPEFDLDPPGFVWSWFLRNSRPNGVGLRRWQSWIWWSRQRGPAAKVMAAVRLVRGFVEAPIEVLRGVRQYGGKTVLVYGVPYTAQFRQLLRLRWQYGVRPESYYKFQMFRPERFHDAPNFVDECGQLLQVLFRRTKRTKDWNIFLSKESFREWCIEKGLSVVGSLLIAKDGAVVARYVDALPAQDIFVKPTNWITGKGTSRWNYRLLEEGGRYVDNAGQKMTAAALEDFVCRSTVEVGRPYLVQPALMNHSSLRFVTNGALATLRIMTTRRRGKSSRPLMAALRMPTGDAVADNFDLGGVAAPVDIESGTCGVGGRKKNGYPPDPVRKHPDTGKVIVGLQIPWWEECVDLVCRAHDVLEADVPVIGWDVAVLDDGPVLIEANHLPGASIAQMPGGLALGATEFSEAVCERLRGAFLV